MIDRDQLIKRQKVLADFGEFAMSSDDLDEVLTAACSLVADAFGTRRAKVLEIQEDGRELLVRAGVGWKPGIVGKLRLSMSEASSESFAIEAAAPVITRDIQDEKRFVFADFMKSEGVRALVNVPIFLPGQRAYGILQVDATEPRDFAEEDTEFLRTYAMILGPVVDRLFKLKRLQESEQRERGHETRFRTIFDTAPVGLSVVSVEGRFLRVNKELARILGRAEHDLVGVAVADVTHAPDVAPTMAAFRQGLTTGETTSLDKHYRRLDGELVPANSTLMPLEVAGSARSVLAVTVDLTARLRAERALRESEKRLAAAFESVPVGLAVIDADGRVVDGNAEYRRFLPTGIAPSRDPERVGRWKAWDELGNLIVPDDYPGAQALRGNSVVPGMEMLYTEDDGREIWTSVSAMPVFGEGSRVTGLISVISDIDDVKRSADALRESEERHRMIVENALDYAIFTMDEEGRVTSWPPGAQAVFGWSEAEMTGQDVAITFTPEDRAEGAPAAELKIAQREGVAPNVRWHLRKDGSRIFIEGSTRPLRTDAGGQVHEFIKIGQNVTGRRQAEERQTILFAEVQHRTRNLIGVIRAMADRTAASAEDLTGFLPTFRDRLGALARVNTLLSRLDSGERIAFDELLRNELGARGVLNNDNVGRIVLDGPLDVRLRSRIVQTFALAIHELTTNAVKYGALSNGLGQLSVTWRLRQDDGRADRLHVEWIESGVADMPEEGAAPRGGGYGRMLIERALPYQLGARTTYDLGRDGVRCTIDLPLR